MTAVALAAMAACVTRSYGRDLEFAGRPDWRRCVAERLGGLGYTVVPGDSAAPLAARSGRMRVTVTGDTLPRSPDDSVPAIRLRVALRGGAMLAAADTLVVRCGRIIVPAD
jgi:hypothetical protein